MDRIASLKRFLNPEKIAVIGASKSKNKVGGIVFRRLLDSRRRLFPVNPKETAIEGYKVSPDIQSLPKDIDLAIITISAAAAVKSVETCIEKGIPNYIIVAGGFGEVGSQGRGIMSIFWVPILWGYFCRMKILIPSLLSMGTNPLTEKAGSPVLFKAVRLGLKPLDMRPIPVMACGPLWD